MAVPAKGKAGRRQLSKSSSGGRAWETEQDMMYKLFVKIELVLMHKIKIDYTPPSLLKVL